MSTSFFVWGATDALLSKLIATIGLSGVILTVGGVMLALIAWLCLRFIPNNCVGVVGKLWSFKGSVPEGQILARRGGNPFFMPRRSFGEVNCQ
jgi:hypothetical protein